MYCVPTIDIFLTDDSYFYKKITVKLPQEHNTIMQM